MNYSFDVVVIGGGPAGIAAARSAAQKGATVALLEREEELGGILPQCIHHGFGLQRFREELTGPEYAERELTLLAKEKVEIFLQTTVVDLHPGLIDAVSPQGSLHFKAGSIILAMGARERTAAAIGLASARPSGIFTAGAAQRLVNIEGCLPGKKAVIVGSGDIGLIMARRLSLEGVKVACVVEILPYPGGLLRNRVQCLDDFDIPLLLSHAVLKVWGEKRVEAVTIAKLDEAGKPIPGTERKVPCDCLLLSVGLIPENELSEKLNLAMDPATGGPVVDQDMETSVRGVFACGNVVAISDLVDDVTKQAELAGERAVELLRNPQSKQGVPLKMGKGVRSLYPQILVRPEPVEVVIRAASPMDKARATIGQASFNLRNVRPAQAVKIKLSAAEVEQILEAQGGTVELEGEASEN
ncbi:MAG: FAD-dependent oxidoreductase [Firmicutes bacterium]|jgi:NADPH-dependent 2,4-dienoyl-CoA reductase/sulfur reductase-like enzyme|nr:FAD-dependent oxidoreductase [Bacillota bacterium]